MPQRHSPPPVSEVDTEAMEKLKRLKKNGSAKGKSALRDLLVEEIASLTHSSIPPEFTTPGEPLNAEASSPSPTLTYLQNGNPSTAVSSSPHDAVDPNKEAAKARNGIIVIDGIEFHHESEAEFASLLNYYGIEWLYEPNQFPLQWRDDRVIEMFRPDFYLVEYDLYIELTTMRQALVRRKNRKLRLLRALYPEINIKLLYRRDYNRLLERFGIKSEGPEQPDTIED